MESNMGGGNGNGNGEGLAATDSWKGRSLDEPGVLQEALLEISEYGKLAVTIARQTGGKITSLEKIVKGDLSELKGILLRVEATGARTEALATATAVRTARLDNEKEIREDEIRRQRKKAEALSIQLADLDKRTAVDATELRTRLAVVEENEDELEEKMENTGQRAISAEMRLEAERAAHASQAEIDKEDRGEKRKIAEERREDKRHLWRYALAFAGAVAFAAICTKCGYDAGHAHPPVPPPAPATNGSAH